MLAAIVLVTLVALTTAALSRRITVDDLLTSLRQLAAAKEQLAKEQGFFSNIKNIGKGALKGGVELVG